MLGGAFRWPFRYLSQLLRNTIRNTIPDVFRDEYPVMLINHTRIFDQDTSVLEFACLNQTVCPSPLEIASIWDSTPNKPGVDQAGKIYLPFYNRSEVLYLDTTQASTACVSVDAGLENFFPISVLQVEGRTLLADLDTLLIVRDDASHKVIELTAVAEPTLMGIGGLVQGTENKVYAFDSSPHTVEGERVALVFTIDLVSENVTPVLLPIFNAEEKERRRVQIVGVSADLSKVYYVFSIQTSEQNESQMRLVMFDTQTKRELHVYRDHCLPGQGYRQYRNYLFISSGSQGPLLLRLDDLSPVVNFTTLPTEFQVLTLAPLGRFFLAGTASEVLVLSGEGDILETYRVPPEFFGKKYIFVEYWDE